MTVGQPKHNEQNLTLFLLLFHFLFSCIRNLKTETDLFPFFVVVAIVPFSVFMFPKPKNGN